MVQPKPRNAFSPSATPPGFSCWGFFTSVHLCDKAKQAATVLRSRGMLGENPSEERTKLKRLIPALAEFAESRYMPFVVGYKRSASGDDFYLRNHLLPRLGSLQLNEIKQEAVIEFHHGIRAKYGPAWSVGVGASPPTRPARPAMCPYQLRCCRC